jgi:hypothetical protein
MAKWLIIYGFFAIITGIVNLVKYLGWKNSAHTAQCRITEQISSVEKKVGGLFNKKLMYQCAYKTLVTGDFGTAEGTLRKDFQTADEGRNLVGQIVRGVSKGNGSFLSDEEFEALRKGWSRMLISGVVCIVIAFILIAAVSSL